MTESTFETENGDIVVHVDGRVRRSPVPDGFDPVIFRDILAVVNIYWTRDGVFPTVDECFKQWPRIPKKTYSKAFATPELEKALELRGITIDKDLGLSPLQATALQLLSDPTDRRAMNTKLRQLGISMVTYQNWMRQPLFSKLFSQRSEQNLGDAVPIALNAIVANAASGDQRAAEKLLEISGRHNPAQQDRNSARDVILLVVEAVLKHVSSQQERTAILGEVEAAMKGDVFQITESPKEIE